MFDESYGPPINISEVIVSNYPHTTIAAEFKRSSPSKGDINMKVNIVDQTLAYVRGGASILSVLTEFKHFKGTLNDMKTVRLATQKEFPTRRPAILRKDFIFDRLVQLTAIPHFFLCLPASYHHSPNM